MTESTQTTINEEAKYIANALDRLSTATGTVGVLTPFVFLTFGIDRFQKWGVGGVVIAVAWFVAAIVLHLAGRSHLGRIR